MTSRSPSQHSKTTTISRRLRYRTDQNLSVQPTEIPRLRNVRPRRATTLPEPRHDLLATQHQVPHQLLVDLVDENFVIDSQASGTSQPVNIGALSQPEDQVLERNLDFSSHNSPQGSATLTAGPQTTRDFPRPHYLTAGFPPSSLPSVSGSLDFEVPLPATDIQQSHNTSVDLQEMSTSGFMMAPSQYGMNHYGSPPSYSQNCPPASQHGYAEHQPSTSGPYDSSYASSPAFSHERRRLDDQTVLPPYQAHPQGLPRSPYQQQPSTSMRSNSASLASNAQGYAYSSHGNIPNQPLGSSASSYPPPQLYPPTSYSISEYQPLPTMYPPSSTTPAAYPAYGSSSGIPQPPPSDMPSLSPSPGAQNSALMPRILNSRPKPQCWEHGCNGRQFSTFSNLLRHQREKSGTASKSYCPRCGAEFTRTTARNGHMAHDKCKPRRPSESSQ